MTHTNKIREYKESDEVAFREFYILLEHTKKRSRVLHALQRNSNARKTWQAGIVGLIGIQLSRHTALSTIFLELLLWSAGVGLVWYRLIAREFENKLQHSSERIAKELTNIKTMEKSKAWLMIKDNDEIVGSIALKYEHGEGKVGLITGQESRHRLLLVQNAIGFARTNKIEVISKWGHEDAKWSENNSL